MMVLESYIQLRCPVQLKSDRESCVTKNEDAPASGTTTLFSRDAVKRYIELDSENSDESSSFYAADVEEEVTEVAEAFGSEETRREFEPWLIVMSGSSIARKFPIRKREVIIGRSTRADVVLAEQDISRRHARLTIIDHRAHIEDLDSTNGTYVNSRPIRTAFIKDSDLITVGPTVMKFTIQTRVDREFHDEMYKSATMDALTTLFNRNYLDKQISYEFAKANRYGRALSFLLIDLDSFKALNDEFGHQAGDRVLQQVGKAVKSCVRKDVDVPCRYGGEELAIVLAGTRKRDARKIAEQVRRKIAAVRVADQDREISITASIGVASKNSAMRTPEDLVRTADRKLYVAKLRGKNRVEA